MAKVVVVAVAVAVVVVVVVVGKVQESGGFDGCNGLAGATS